MTVGDVMEPACANLIQRRAANRKLLPYVARSTASVGDSLSRFFERMSPGCHVEGVQRMGGGASKEQFRFRLAQTNGQDGDYVLRMDPRAAITETDRRREFEILNAVQGIVPAPKPAWIDDDGQYFGQPAVIMEFVSGVTKPSAAPPKATGVGTWLGDPLRSRLRGQFIEYLARLHALDWSTATLPSYRAPTADRQQAARWSLNYWRALWALDKVEDRPIMALAEQWLIKNVPGCGTQDLVLIHGDYRTGNYLFDENSARITAVLDWELARIGDFHEDLAYSLLQVFGTWEGGLFRASDLYPREEMIRAYESASGRSVNRKTLHYYDVLSAWKVYIVVAANGLSAARHKHNHQDVLLSFVGATAPMFANDLCRLLSTRATD
jgi:aminoglycoside phosphotransferase (APT) family kinase protein